jgi:hypothetical protein
MTSTLYSEKRQQQRGFKKDLTAFLLDYGLYVNCGGGRERVFLTGKKLKSLLNSKKINKNIKSFIRSNFNLLTKKALIISDVIITAYNKTGKLRN